MQHQYDPHFYSARLSKVINPSTIELIVDLGFNVFLCECFSFSGVSIDGCTDDTLQILVEFVTKNLHERTFIIKSDKFSKKTSGKYFVTIFLEEFNFNDHINIFLNSRRANG
jgi:hypothetical protein